MGGNGGTPYEFVKPNLSLVGARGRKGAALDAIQFLFIDIDSGQFVESEGKGGKGGTEWMFVSPPGQWITKIVLSHDKIIQSIMF
ncbi:MAG: hypothetical protein KDD45_08470 [Bdellovibrionales bacterium]|nr:hypothetical protein [Bdellovibrionales bacterium]